MSITLHVPSTLTSQSDMQIGVDCNRYKQNRFQGLVIVFCGWSY